MSNVGSLPRVRRIAATLGYGLLPRCGTRMTDSKRAALVYELYGLTDQEIALVESATRND